MPTQRFNASNDDKHTWPNGAVGQGQGCAVDLLGPYARVTNCPVYGTSVRMTCYATSYPEKPDAQGMTRVRAAMQYKRQHVSGYFHVTDEALVFHADTRYQNRLT